MCYIESDELNVRATSKYLDTVCIWRVVEILEFCSYPRQQQIRRIISVSADRSNHFQITF